MSEKKSKTAEPGIESLAIDVDKFVNGRWVPVPGTSAEILVPRLNQADYVEWLGKPENQKTREKGSDYAARAFYGERIIQEIRGVSFEWSPEKGRKLLTQTKQVESNATGEDVEVYVYDPIYQAAASYAESSMAYMAKILPN
ncbi:MAG: hypothetical protein AAF196_16975 [Planctomycetota bacterium]